MNLVSLRVITADVDRLVDFYTRLTGAHPHRPVPDFAEIRTPGGTLALASTRTLRLFDDGSGADGALVVPATNRSVIIELLVEDVDTTYAALRSWVSTFVAGPTTTPWGNRSLLLRDPDGNLVNLFTPVTPAAVQKFARHER